MDLCISWPGLAPTQMWDVTVRAAARAGAADASATGVANKARRYGSSVSAISTSSRGRMHATSIAAVHELAALSRVWGKHEFGRPPGVRSARLRLAIEGAVVRTLADATLVSLGAANCAVLGHAAASALAAHGRLGPGGG